MQLFEKQTRSTSDIDDVEFLVMSVLLTQDQPGKFPSNRQVRVDGGGEVILGSTGAVEDGVRIRPGASPCSRSARVSVRHVGTVAVPLRLLPRE